MGLSNAQRRVGLWTLGAILPLVFWRSLWADPVVVNAVRGPAEIRRARAQNNKWYALRKGSSVKPGDEIRTGKSSRAVLKLDDGSRVVLSGGSRAKVLESSPNRIFALAVGRMKSFVKKLKPTSKFEVRTPLAAASVRGTIFEMGVGEDGKDGYLEVGRGVVNLAQGGRDMDVHAGERVDFMSGWPLGDPVPGKSSENSPADEDKADDKSALKHEVGLGMSKEAVMAAAAEEMRLAEYQEGKTLIDVNGDRVRLEEYIIRRPQELAANLQDRAFKLVVLNERDNRFDYFYYRGVFNQTLPDDLSVALNDVRGQLGAAAPDYYLDSYEMGQSNTQDSVLDQANGGHLVKITYDGTNYYLEDPTDATNTRTILADEVTTTAEGTFHKVYDPVGDRFVTITDAQFNAGGGGAGVYDASQDTFRTLTSADTFWRTAFNNYSHLINGNSKQSYVPDGSLGITNILAQDQDATYTFAGGSVFPVTETPSGADVLHNRVTLYYGDGTTETVNTYIMSDDGKIGPVSAFDGLTTGSAFKDQLLQWNYEQVTEATEFQGRKIDLVVEPKILIKSGLLK